MNLHHVDKWMITKSRDSEELKKLKALQILQNVFPKDLWNLIVEFAFDGGQIMQVLLTFGFTMNCDEETIMYFGMDSCEAGNDRCNCDTHLVMRGTNVNRWSSGFYVLDLLNGCENCTNEEESQFYLIRNMIYSKSCNP